MKTQDVTMLCPVCQSTRRCTIGIDIPGEDVSTRGEPKGSMGVSIWAKCRSCGSDMYCADEDLVPALKMLNDAGISTTHHCSMSHPEDGYENSCKRVYKHPYNRDKYVRGPYIGIKGLSEEEVKDLYDFMKRRTSDYTGEETLRLEYEHEIHVKRKLFAQKDVIVDKITLMVMCANIETETLKEACQVLTEFISDWLKSTNNGELPTGKGNMLKHIANKTYIYPTAYDINRSAE